jgi:hypothetical protein
VLMYSIFSGGFVPSYLATNGIDWPSRSGPPTCGLEPRIWIAESG